MNVGKDGENNLILTYYNGELISVSHTTGPFGVSFDPDGNFSGTFTIGTATTGYMTLSAPIFSKNPMFTIEMTAPFMGPYVSTGVEFNFRPGGFTGIGVATFGIGAEAMGMIIPSLNYGY